MSAANNWNLNIELYGDVGSLAGVEETLGAGWPRGFTTNATLMKQDGVTDFRGFVEQIVTLAGERPVSLPVLADDPGANLLDLLNFDRVAPGCLRQERLRQSTHH